MRYQPVGLLLIFLVFIAGCAGHGKDQNHAEAHYMLGLSFLKEQNPTLALKEFLVAAERNPRDPRIQAALGQAYQLKKAYPEAEKHYLRALKLDPRDSLVRNNLGALYLDMKRWDDAILYFRQASSDLLFTSPEIALMGLGFAHFQKGDYQAASAAYRDALEHAPRSPRAHYLLGEAYFAVDQVEMAAAEFQQALSLAGDYPQAHYKLALTYLKMRQTEKAASSFREVIRLAPGSELAVSAKNHLKVLK